VKDPVAALDRQFGLLLGPGHAHDDAVVDTGGIWAAVVSLLERPQRPPRTRRPPCWRTEHVLAERLASRSRLLGAVQHGRSLQLSGRAVRKCLELKGRYS